MKPRFFLIFATLHAFKNNKNNKNTETKKSSPRHEENSIYRNAVCQRISKEQVENKLYMHLQLLKNF